MGIIILPTSPWRFYQATDANGASIWAQVTFTGTFADADPLTGGSVHRDATCLYTKVIIGSINQDGTLPAGTKVVNVPSGDTNFSAAQLSLVGLNTLADVRNAPQITASP